MEKVRDEQIEYQQKQRESGLRGVEAKKRKGIFPFNESSNPSSNPSTDPATQNQALQSSTSSSFKDKENPRARASQKSYQTWQEKKDAEYDRRQPQADPLCHICKVRRTHMEKDEKPTCPNCWGKG